VKPVTVPALARLHAGERREALEQAAAFFDHARYRVSDPVGFVWSFPSAADREIAAWAASALAYGRVASILQGLQDLNRRWEGQPAAFMRQASRMEQQKALQGFVYRWTRDHHLLGYLRGYSAVQSRGDVGAQLATRVDARPGGLRQAMAWLATEIRSSGELDPGHLLPDPAATSACKRPAMWLRWMVRKDQIDPGLWADRLSPAHLWVPLDTHMFRIARRLRLTRRKNPDAEAARRITAAFARMCPEDPVKYDFAITRLGMGVD
jgi:uncharacterized protein (TIGR02757 family)